MKTLTDIEIKRKLQELPNWEYKANALHTRLKFRDFKEAFSAMTRIAFEAELQQHHPDWKNTYNVLEISLSTHDAGGVTEKDLKLASIISGYYPKKE